MNRKTPSGIFITGTNTGVGKTIVATSLLMAANNCKIHAKYFKPIQTGTDSDCKTVLELSKCLPQQIIHPVYEFNLPTAVYTAAKIEKMKVSIEKICEYFSSLDPSHFYIVEGAGGLLHPLSEEALVADLIFALQLPLVIVVSTVLGSMNHALLTIEAAQKRNIPIKGLILVGPAYEGLDEIIFHFSKLPILAELPLFESLETNSLLSQTSKIFPQNVTQKILN